MNNVPGRRIEPNGAGYLLLPPGGYGRDIGGQWWLRPPGYDAVMVDNAGIAVHADGTVSYLRTIGEYHLERGHWLKE